MTDYEKYLEAENLKKDEEIKGLKHDVMVMQSINNELNTRLYNKAKGRTLPAMVKPVTYDFEGITEGTDND